MPVVYLPHGGGPWPFVELGFGPPGMWDRMRAYLEALSALPRARPQAVLTISAHWEATRPTVMTAARPPMLYDYYGFPEASYRITWPAPGAPAVAERVRALLARAGIDTAADAQRGFDHGAFVPLKLAYPEAEVPTTQLSLVAGLDPATHLAVGRALAPLRDEGVFIVGSGMSFHNMQALMRPSDPEPSRRFDQWLAETVALPPAERDARLVRWEQAAPHARYCHPREEHLLPLMVVAGAAGDDVGHTPYRDVVMGAHVSASHFG